MSMFSGLTNQFSTLLGKGGEGGEATGEQQPVAAQEAVEQAPIEAAVEGAEAGAEGGKAGVFSGVSSKMTGWLSSAPSIPSMPAMPNISMPAMPTIPNIPGLRKTQTQDEGAGGIANEALATSPDGQTPGIGDQTAGAEEDDRSSATGGADSRPNSPIADEEAGQIGNVKAKTMKVFRDIQGSLADVKQVNMNEVTTKVTAGAKSFGSFLYSAVNKAGDKLKESVVHNPILDKFNKEQDAFIKSQGGADAGITPWAGHQAEEKIKEEVMALSADRRNFVRSPPAGVDFEFNYDQSYPVAVAIMNEDKQLEQMRFELVPKIITEEQFWRNYFYRVSLIVEAGDLGTLGSENEFPKRASSDEATNKLDDDAKKRGNKENPLPTKTTITTSTAPLDTAKVKTVDVQSESEFVSDTLQTNEADLEEVKAGMKKLGIDTLAKQALDTKSEEQWEKDLEAELQDYEVVNEGNDANDADVDDLLDDLK